MSADVGPDDRERRLAPFIVSPCISREIIDLLPVGCNRKGHMNDKTSSPSVISHAVQILRCFTPETQLLGVTELAEKIGLHKSSVSRLLSTMQKENLVEQDEGTKKFRLGLGLIAVAGPLLANLEVRRVAFPYLKELRDELEETVALNVWEGAAAVSVEQLASRRTIKHTSQLGSRYSSSGSATVQVFLSDLDKAEIHELLESGKVTLDVHRSEADLLSSLETVRSNGYALNLRGTSDDEVGVAAPVRDHRGTLVAAVLVAAPSYRISEKHLAQLISHTLTAAKTISTRLGYIAAAEE